MKNLIFCDHVRIKSVYPNRIYEGLNFYTTVSVGKRITDDAIVTYMSPRRECILSPSTTIELIEYSEYKIEELKNNYLIEMTYRSFGRKKTNYFVYAKSVWKEIEKRFLIPLSNLKPPREQGALLYGSAGTGKTSSAILIADILGLSTITITRTSTLSKWLGESEQRLAMQLKEAERLQPSLVLIDDAEWLTRDRELGAQGEMHQTMLSLLDELLGVIDYWKKTGKLIVTLLTTNLKEEMIDKAFRRGGRLGRPIFVPTPDFEAVYEYMVRNGVDPKTAEKYAIKIVNSGLPMSDVEEITNDILNNMEPEIKPIKGMGYQRQISPAIDKKVLEPLKPFSEKLCAGLTQGSRLVFYGSSNLTIPVITTAVGIFCKKSTIIATDPQMITEAINTADATNGVLVIPYEYIPFPEIIGKAFANTRMTIIVTGIYKFSQETNMPPMASIGTIDDLITTPSQRLALTYIIKEFYGLPMNNKDIEDSKKLPQDKYKQFIYYASLYHADLKSLKRLIA